MVDETTKPAIDAPVDVVNEPLSEPAQADIPPSGQRSRALLWLVVVVSLLIALGTAGGGWWLWQQTQLQQQHQQQAWQALQSAVEAARTEESRQLADALATQASLRGQLNDLHTQIQAIEAQAKSNQQSLAEVSGRRPSDWLLAEADYLVRMAGRKMWLEHDISTAILMLQSADARLADLADPSLLPIRQRLADDIQTLKNINPVSLTSVALALSALQPQVAHLEIAMPEIPEIASMDSTASDDVSDWQANLGKLWSFFKNELVNYQPRTLPMRPLLNQQQQWLVQEQLTLALAQAKSAALAEQSTLYQQALQRALAVLVEHYDIQSTQVSQFMSAVQQLAETDIERTYPEQLSAAQPLKDVLSHRLQQAYNNAEVAPL
ncbi:uroporphyrinogen-III C-methyltransferase [Aestuariibacter halophilus]|uniref:Uroporphyrinogen-III C-methyltransferase n=1 Tax=Fluctibacter halophilus TaxID=226011 RepID=A0ABS8GAW1_9ALTE|nr:uroporphyrinogen-III C-methyltransferase [Aestuariibacter halophilus]MCC2617538.1 uroporphyrinogen-III C-methyltransferase [Aestuariibacter halophilus]